MTSPLPDVMHTNQHHQQPQSVPCSHYWFTSQQADAIDFTYSLYSVCTVVEFAQRECIRADVTTVVVTVEL